MGAWKKLSRNLRNTCATSVHPIRCQVWNLYKRLGCTPETEPSLKLHLKFKRKIAIPFQPLSTNCLSLLPLPLSFSLSVEFSIFIESSGSILSSIFISNCLSYVFIELWYAPARLMPLQAFALKWKFAKLEQGEREMLEKMKEKRAWVKLLQLLLLLMLSAVYLHWLFGQQHIERGTEVEGKWLW